MTPSLCYYFDSDFLVESDTYILEKVLDHRGVGKGKNKRYEWYVQYRGYPEADWQSATSFLHDINEDWRKYNTKHGIDLTPSQVCTLQAQTASHACYKHTTDLYEEMEAVGSVTIQGRADVLQEEQLGWICILRQAAADRAGLTTFVPLSVADAKELRVICSLRMYRETYDRRAAL